MLRCTSIKASIRNDHVLNCSKCNTWPDLIWLWPLSWWKSWRSFTSPFYFLDDITHPCRNEMKSLNGNRKKLLSFFFLLLKSERQRTFIWMQSGCIIFKNSKELKRQCDNKIVLTITNSIASNNINKLLKTILKHKK